MTVVSHELPYEGRWMCSRLTAKPVVYYDGMLGGVTGSSVTCRSHLRSEERNVFAATKGDDVVTSQVPTAVLTKIEFRRSRSCGFGLIPSEAYEGDGFDAEVCVAPSWSIDENGEDRGLGQSRGCVAHVGGESPAKFSSDVRRRSPR